MTILGDNAQLFMSLEIRKSRKNQDSICNEVSIMVQDILYLAKLNNLSFKNVPRSFVNYADKLAKTDRLMDQQYVISWLNS